MNSTVTDSGLKEPEYQISEYQISGLSAGQRRIWSIVQSAARQVNFNVPVCLDFDGSLDEQALRMALREVVQRHAMLRTVFVATADDLQRRTTGSLPDPLQVVDCDESHWDEATRARLVQPLPMQGAAPWFVVLMRGRRRSRLLGVFHHAIFDGRSEALFIADLAQAYAAPESLGDTPAVAPPYVADLAESRDFWRDKLSTSGPAWLLPSPPLRRGATAPAPAAPAVRGIGARLGDAAARCRCTPAVIGLAAMALSTAVAFGRRTVPVAVSFDGEDKRDIGFTVNVLPVVIAVETDATLLEFVHEVRDSLLEAMCHAQVPIEEILSYREDGAAHLTQFAYAYHEIGDEALQKAHEAFGVRFVRQDLAVGEPQSAVALHLRREAGAFSRLWHSDPDRITPALLSQFEQLTDAVLERLCDGLCSDDAATPIRPWLARERGRLASDPLGRRAEVRPGGALWPRLEQLAKLQPHAAALRFADRPDLSYASLVDAARAQAASLRSCVRAGDSVVIVASRSAEYVAAAFACWSLGASIVPLEPEVAESRLHDVIATVRPVVGLHHRAAALPASYADKLPWVAMQWATASPGEATPSQRGDDFENSTAYVMFSSGTTGRPKAIAITQGAVSRFAQAQAYCPMGPSDVVLHAAPITFDASVFELFAPLLNGACVSVLADASWGVPELLAHCERTSVNKLWLTAGLFNAMVDDLAAGSVHAKRFDTLVFGGEAASPRHVQLARRVLPGVRLVNGYGPTECTTFAACHVVDDDPSGEEDVPIGVPLPGTTIHVLSEERLVQLPGALGEIAIAGDRLSLGYVSDAELTETRFRHCQIDGAPAGEGERMYFTGDLGWIDEQGRLRYAGRRDRQVKIRGHLVEPGELELALLGLHGVRDAAVIAQTLAAGHARLVAWVVPDHDRLQPDSVRSALAQRLPPYMMPSLLRLVTALPKLPSGKVDLQAIARQAAEQRDDATVRTSSVRGDDIHVVPDDALAVKPVALADPAMELLADCWRRVLEVDSADGSSNFFADGGDSLLAIRLKSALARRGYTVDILDILGARTLKDMAEQLQPAVSAGARSEPAYQPFAMLAEADRDLARSQDLEDAFPLTSMQQGMVFHSMKHGGSNAYRDVSSYEFFTPYDDGRLKQALAGMAQRHSALRSTIDLVSFEEPLQCVHRRATPHVEVIDAGPLPPSERLAYIQAWSRTQASRKAPLTAGAYKVFVHLCGPDSHIVSLVFHHALLDGWSESLWASELVHRVLDPAGAAAPAYTAAPEGEARLSAQVRLEREAHADEAALAHWKAVVRSLPPSLLPVVDFAAAMDVAGTLHELDADTTAALERLAERTGVALKVLLMAVHLKALATVFDRCDTVTGVVTNGRPETAGGDSLLGMFLNVLPMGLRVNDDLNSMCWELASKEALLTRYRRVPLQRLMSDARVAQPFDTAFNYVHFRQWHDKSAQFERQMKHLYLFAQSSIPVTCHFARHPQGLRVSATCAAVQELTVLADRIVREQVRLLQQVAGAGAEPGAGRS